MYIFVLLIFGICSQFLSVNEVFGVAASYKTSISQAAKIVFKAQNEILVCKRKIYQLDEKEKTYFNLIKNNEKYLKTIACSINSFEKISFPLVFLSKESVQALILLERFFPVIQQKIAPILPYLQELATIRKKIIYLKKELILKEKAYNASINILSLEISKKYETLTVSCPTPIIYNPQDIEKCIIEISNVFKSNEKIFDLNIIQPIIGDLSYKDLKLFIQSEAGSYIISPWKAQVVNITFKQEEGYRVILKQGEYFCVIYGIGSLVCQTGEYLNPYDPIGQSLGHVIQVETRKNDQLIDIKPYLKFNL